VSLPSHSSTLDVIIQRIPFGSVRRDRGIHAPQSCLPSSFIFTTSLLSPLQLCTLLNMLLLVAISATFSLASSCVLPSDPTTNPQECAAQHDDLATPNVPAAYLPPGWPFESNLDSPYPSNDESQWDDKGHSQMVDNEVPIWLLCPQYHLDCRKCPGDARCRRPHFPELYGEPATSADLPPEDDGQGNCPLGSTRCDDNIQTCGANAQCTRGFCLCKLGWKGSSSEGEGYRSNDGLGAVTVYNSLGAACDVECDDASCKEVEQLKENVCFRNGEQSGGGVQAGGYDDLELAGVTFDNVDLTSADAVLEMMSDSVAGVADGGEAN
jgi:hypothetical protein